MPHKKGHTVKSVKKKKGTFEAKDPGARAAKRFFNRGKTPTFDGGQSLLPPNQSFVKGPQSPLQNISLVGGGTGFSSPSGDITDVRGVPGTALSGGRFVGTAIDPKTGKFETLQGPPGGVTSTIGAGGSGSVGGQDFTQAALTLSEQFGIDVTPENLESFVAGNTGQIDLQNFFEENVNALDFVPGSAGLRLGTKVGKEGIERLTNKFAKKNFDRLGGFKLNKAGFKPASAQIVEKSEIMGNKILSTSSSGWSVKANMYALGKIKTKKTTTEILGVKVKEPVEKIIEEISPAAPKGETLKQLRKRINPNPIKWTTKAADKARNLMGKILSNRPGKMSMMTHAMYLMGLMSGAVYLRTQVADDQKDDLGGYQYIAGQALRDNNFDEVDRLYKLAKERKETMDEVEGIGLYNAPKEAANAMQSDWEKIESIKRQSDFNRNNLTEQGTSQSFQGKTNAEKVQEGIDYAAGRRDQIAREAEQKAEIQAEADDIFDARRKKRLKEDAEIREKNRAQDQADFEARQKFFADLEKQKAASKKPTKFVPDPSLTEEQNRELERKFNAQRQKEDGESNFERFKRSQLGFGLFR